MIDTVFIIIFLCHLGNKVSHLQCLNIPHYAARFLPMPGVTTVAHISPASYLYSV